MKKLPEKFVVQPGSIVPGYITAINSLIDCVAELQELEKRREGIMKYSQLSEKTYTLAELREKYDENCRLFNLPLRNSQDLNHFLDWLESEEK